MNFDKGWSRIEALLLIGGVWFMAFLIYISGERIIKSHEWYFIGTPLIPWLIANIIKWFTVGFRNEETVETKTGTQQTTNETTEDTKPKRDSWRVQGG